MTFTLSLSQIVVGLLIVLALVGFYIESRH